MHSYVDTKNIKSKIDTLELLEEYQFARIKDEGENLKALCPYHDDHDPSFSIRKSDTSFRCWSCGANGDAISLVMDMENLPFQSAVLKLALKVGYDIGEYDDKLNFLKSKWADKASQPDVPKKSIKKNDRIKGINEFALKFFMEQFKDSFAEKFVQNRGYTKEEAAAGFLGYCPENYLDFYLALSRNGFNEVDMVESGLFIPTSPLISRFAGRLIFPLFEIDKTTMGFSGRALSNDVKPVYTATPNSEYYNKGLLLYGLQTVKRNKPIVLVEGNFDYLRLAQSGINTLAQLGSALTQEQCDLLKHLSGKVIILYDGDESGLSAARKNFVRLVEAGVLVRVASLPVGSDPDSYVKAYNIKNLKKILRMSKSGGAYWSSWQTDVSVMLSSLGKIKFPNILNHYIQSIASATGTSKDVLKIEIAKVNQ